MFYSAQKSVAQRLDRRQFAQRYLKHHVPLAFGQHHDDFFDNGGFKLEAIAAPRGSAKTTFFTLIDVIYAICYELQDFIIIISETKSLAVERLMDVRMELETNERIQADFGDLIGPNWRQDDIICSNGVRVTAKGRGGQIRGSKHRASRPSLIILDDVESSDSVLSPLQREKVEKWYSTDVRRAGRPDGSTKFRIVGTFLHPDALLPQLTENPAYHSKIYKAVISWSNREDLWSRWTAIYSDLSNPSRIEDARKYYNENEKEMLAGVELLWPEGIDYYTVMEAIISEGRYAALKEFQNEMYDPTQFLFAMDKAVRFKTDADGIHRSDGRFVKWSQLSGVSYFLDWAGAKASQDNCYPVAVAVAWESFPASAEAYTYILDTRMDRVPPSQQIESLFDLHEHWSMLPQFRCGIEGFIDTTSLIEDNVKKIFYDEVDKRRKNGKPYNLFLEFVRRHQAKLERITTALEHRIRNGWLSFNETLPVDFMRQFEQFPTHQFVDAPDAVEGALTLFMSPVKIQRNEPKRDNRVYLR